MSYRLDTDRQEKFEPLRMAHAKKKLAELGIIVTNETKNELHFQFKGNLIKLFPYSGWHTGKGIQDGRGLEKLLRQLTTQTHNDCTHPVYNRAEKCVVCGEKMQHYA